MQVNVHIIHDDVLSKRKYIVILLIINIRYYHTHSGDALLRRRQILGISPIIRYHKTSKQAQQV